MYVLFISGNFVFKTSCCDQNLISCCRSARTSRSARTDARQESITVVWVWQRLVLVSKMSRHETGTSFVFCQLGTSDRLTDRSKHGAVSKRILTNFVYMRQKSSSCFVQNSVSITKINWLMLFRELVRRWWAICGARCVSRLPLLVHSDAARRWIADAMWHTWYLRVTSKYCLCLVTDSE